MYTGKKNFTITRDVGVGFETVLQNPANILQEGTHNKWWVNKHRQIEACLHLALLSSDENQ